MSGKTEVGPTKYPATSDLQSGYFFVQVCLFFFVFLVSQESAIDHLLSGEIYFGLLKVLSLQDLLSSEILTLLGKTGVTWKRAWYPSNTRHHNNGRLMLCHHLRWRPAITRQWLHTTCWPGLCTKNTKHLSKVVITVYRY